MLYSQRIRLLKVRMRNQRGVSLIELVLTLATTIGLVTALAILPSLISSINTSRHNSIAKDAATMEIDSLRKSGYTNLALGSGSFSDPSLSVLTSSSASYEVLSCPPEVCTQEEEVKEIKVAVTWLEGKSNQKVELTTLVSQGGVGQ